MSHQVETMAYTHQVPWHGLGVNSRAKTVEGWCADAGLEWKVAKQPMFWASDKFAAGVVKNRSAKTTIPQSRLVADHYALVRDKDESVLDVVGPDYTPRQNAEVLGFFKEFVEAGKATIETAGSLRGGRVVWALANLKTSFELRGRDRVNGYLLAVSYHQQGKANLYKTTAVRVVCANTLAMSLREGGGFKDYHSTKFDAAQIERAKEALGIARSQFDDFGAAARKLQSLKLKTPDVVRVVADTFDPSPERVLKKDGTAHNDPAVREAWTMYIEEFDKAASRSVKDIMKAYTDAPGAAPGDGWGALNAVTYYCDHQASRTPDKRLTNTWLGKTSRQKEAVFATLMGMAS